MAADKRGVFEFSLGQILWLCLNVSVLLLAIRILDRGGALGPYGLVEASLAFLCVLAFLAFYSCVIAYDEAHEKKPQSPLITKVNYGLAVVTLLTLMIPAGEKLVQMLYPATVPESPAPIAKSPPSAVGGSAVPLNVPLPAPAISLSPAAEQPPRRDPMAFTDGFVPPHREPHRFSDDPPERPPMPPPARRRA